MEEYFNISILIGSAVGSGGIASVLTNYLLKKKELVNNEYISLIGVLREQNNDLSTKQKENDERIKNAEEKTAQLKNQLSEFKMLYMTYESLHLDLPLPQWVKSKDGRMVMVNRQYEKVFLIPVNKTALDYAGKTDIEFWGEEIGKHYSHNDNKVIDLEQPVYTLEPTLNSKGDTIYWHIYKFPLYIGGKISAVGGLAYSPDDENPPS